MLMEGCRSHCNTITSSKNEQVFEMIFELSKDSDQPRPPV